MQILTCAEAIIFQNRNNLQYSLIYMQNCRQKVVNRGLYVRAEGP